MGFWRANNIPYIWDGSEWMMSNPSMVATFMFRELIAYYAFEIKDFINAAYTPYDVYQIFKDLSAGEDFLLDDYDAWIEKQIIDELNGKMRAGRDFDAFGIHFVWVEPQGKAGKRR